MPAGRERGVRAIARRRPSGRRAGTQTPARRASPAAAPRCRPPRRSGRTARTCRARRALAARCCACATRADTARTPPWSRRAARLTWPTRDAPAQRWYVAPAVNACSNRWCAASAAKSTGNEVDERCLAARHHRCEPLVQQAQRVVNGVETGDGAGARVADDRAQAIERDRKLAHRVAHDVFHLRLRLLVAVDEAIRAADVVLAEAARGATCDVDGAEARDALEARAVRWRSRARRGFRRRSSRVRPRAGD